MKKYIFLTTLALCLLITACNTLAPMATGEQANTQTITDDTAILLPPETDAEMLDTMYEKMASGESNGAQLEQIKHDEPDVLLDYLMTAFLNGSLEGCQFNDGSVASLQYATWSDMLAGESIQSEAETPQKYWAMWCEHIEQLYSGNGYEFFVEQGYPISAKYIELKYSTN